MANYPWRTSANQNEYLRTSSGEVRIVIRTGKEGPFSAEYRNFETSEETKRFAEQRFREICLNSYREEFEGEIKK